MCFEDMRALTHMLQSLLPCESYILFVFALINSSSNRDASRKEADNKAFPCVYDRENDTISLRQVHCECSIVT
jgi:hypothetical protein